MISVSKDDFLAFIQRYRAEVGGLYARSHIAADCVIFYDKTTDEIVAKACAPTPDESYYISEIGSANVTR